VPELDPELLPPVALPPVLAEAPLEPLDDPPELELWVPVESLPLPPQATTEVTARRAK
jgi:hypothetical protein